MLNMVIFLFTLSMISLLFLFFNYLIFKNKFMSREKNSSFECGFDIFSNPHTPLSVHFFLISLLFLIFDIEITLLLPIIIHLKNMNNSLVLSTFLFIIILILSIYAEYSEDMMEWKKI